MLKINNYSLEEGEQSVFDSELKGRKEGKKESEKARAGHDYENQPMCQACWGKGELVCCDFCPAAYHPSCLGIENVDDLPAIWSCPHHKCVLCERRAAAAGGLLFRCTDCPKAYCEDHLTLESELLGGEVDRLMKLGFGAVKQACYCLCSAECKETAQQRIDDGILNGEEEEDDEDGGRRGRGGGGRRGRRRTTTRTRRQPASASPLRSSTRRPPSPPATTRSSPRRPRASSALGTPSSSNRSAAATRPSSTSSCATTTTSPSSKR